MAHPYQRIRRLKYYLYKYGIHRLLPDHALKFGGHLSGLSRWIATHQNLAFSDFPTKDFQYARRYELHEHVITKVLDTQAIDYLEFGVSKGASFRWWVDRMTDPDARFYGFDTFTGLPEAWGKFKAGDMGNGNEPPVIPNDQRHTFYQGLFQATLPGFLKTFDPSRRKVIHLDADIYSATLYVLTQIHPFLKAGDVLLFDEFNVPMHEYKAFTEWVAAFYVDYEVLGAVNNYYQVAILFKG